MKDLIKGRDLSLTSNNSNSTMNITKSDTKNPEEIFKSSLSKFPGFKMADSKNITASSNLQSDMLNMNSSGNDFMKTTKTKIPFKMKKFEEVTDNVVFKNEIIEDLKKADNVTLIMFIIYNII
jgi:hypothetical protein